MAFHGAYADFEKQQYICVQTPYLDSLSFQHRTSFDSAPLALNSSSGAFSLPCLHGPDASPLPASLPLHFSLEFDALPTKLTFVRRVRL